MNFTLSFQWVIVIPFSECNLSHLPQLVKPTFLTRNTEAVLQGS